jgi:hypothetical protein
MKNPMDLRFERYHDEDRDVVILTPNNEVKHSRVSHKSHTSAAPYNKQYKQRASAIKKFMEIINKVIEDEE